MNSNFSSLKDLLARNIKTKGFTGKVEATLVLEEFDKIVRKIWPADIATAMKGAYFRNGVLAVAVLHSTVGQEIKFRKKLILTELARKFGIGKIKDIIFII
jgi:hypothetical protein